MAERLNSSCNEAGTRWCANPMNYDAIMLGATNDGTQRQQYRFTQKLAKPKPKYHTTDNSMLVVGGGGNSSPRLTATFQNLNFNMLQSGSSGVHSWHSARQEETNATQSPHAMGRSLVVNGRPAAAMPINGLQQKQPSSYNNNNNNNNNNTSNNNNVKICKTPTADQFSSLHARLKPRNKSEEAVTDLLQRIPDVGRIFDVHSRIGNGTFSTVLLATLKREAGLPDSIRRKFAIKHHIPTSHPDRLMKELQCMTKMGGIENVVGINCCLRCDASAAFVMPYMPHDRFHDFYTKMDVLEIRKYMQNLLIALRHVHKFNIIHRDVKPSNFLYNRRRGEFLLVDFGLAQQVNLPMAQLQQALEQRRCAQMASSHKRPREREAMDTTASGACASHHMQQQAGAVGTSDAKRMRLNEEERLCAGAGSKMPLKPVNEIAQHIRSVEALTLNDVKQHAAGEAQPAAAADVAVPATAAAAHPPAGNAPAADNTSRYNTNRNVAAGGNKCYCFANPSVCLCCLMKKEVHASRAGTPGYRPPEVLLKYADQTTAVDVWAAGVIFMSILSSVYPFFKAPNDYIALAEIVTIFGDRAIRKTALALERMVTLSQRSRPLNLRKLCLRFRHRAIFSDPVLIKQHETPDGHCEVCKNCDQFYFNCLCEDSPYETESLDGFECFPASAYDLLGRLLEVNPHKRITAEEALNHPFFTEDEDVMTPRKRCTPKQQQQQQPPQPPLRKRQVNGITRLPSHAAGHSPATVAAAEATQQYAVSFTQLQASLNKL